MSVALAYAANLVAITVLVFGLYFPATTAETSWSPTWGSMSG